MLTHRQQYRCLQLCRLTCCPALYDAVMSSNGEHTTVMRGVTHGACDFLIKPVRIEELRNIWQHVVRRSKHQQVRQHKGLCRGHYLHCLQLQAAASSCQTAINADADASSTTALGREPCTNLTAPASCLPTASVGALILWSPASPCISIHCLPLAFDFLYSKLLLSVRLCAAAAEGC